MKIDIDIKINDGTSLQRRFTGDYDDMHNKDWIEEVRDMIDALEELIK